MPAAALAAALAALLALAAFTGVPMVVAAVLLIQVLVALAPAPADDRGRTVRAPRLEAVLVSGITATVLTLWPTLLVGADGTRAGSVGLIVGGTMAPLVPAVTLGLGVALFSQLLRRDGRKALITSTGYTATLTVFGALPIGWLTAMGSIGGREVVVVCAASVAAAMVLCLVPIDRRITGPLGALGGAVAGAVIAGVATDYTAWLFGGVVGLGTGGLAVLGLTLGRAWGSGRRHASAGWGLPGALALVFAGPAVHLAGLLSGSL